MNAHRQFSLKPGPVRVTALAVGSLLLVGLVVSSTQISDQGGDKAASTRTTNPSHASRSNDTLAPTRPALASPPQPPAVVPEKKKQARLLGVLGLVICSVLALATGLALLRSIRQR